MPQTPVTAEDIRNAIRKALDTMNAHVNVTFAGQNHDEYRQSVFGHLESRATLLIVAGGFPRGAAPIITNDDIPLLGAPKAAWRLIVLDKALVMLNACAPLTNATWDDLEKAPVFEKAMALLGNARRRELKLDLKAGNARIALCVPGVLDEVTADLRAIEQLAGEWTGRLFWKSDEQTPYIVLTSPDSDLTFDVKLNSPLSLGSGLVYLDRDSVEGLSDGSGLWITRRSASGSCRTTADDMVDEARKLTEKAATLLADSAALRRHGHEHFATPDGA